MKKAMMVLLTAALAGGILLTGCGSEEPSAASGGTAQTGQQGSESKASSGTTKKKEFQDLGEVTVEGIPGVLIEDGEDYFAIDSMELTDEGIVIGYRAKSDTGVGTKNEGKYMAQCVPFQVGGEYPGAYARTAESSRGNLAELPVGGEEMVTGEIVIPGEYTEKPEISGTIRMGYYDYKLGMRESVKVDYTIKP